MGDHNLEGIDTLFGGQLNQIRFIIVSKWPTIRGTNLLPFARHKSKLCTFSDAPFFSELTWSAQNQIGNHKKSCFPGTKWQTNYRKKLQCGKRALMIYANSEAPDKSVHPCSLIWTFSSRWHILQSHILYAGNEGPVQPARLRRLIRICVVRKMHKSPFRVLRFMYCTALNCAGWSGSALSAKCIKVLFVPGALCIALP